MHLTSPIAQPPRSSTHACAQVGTCETVGMYVEEVELAVEDPGCNAVELCTLLERGVLDGGVG